MPTRFETMDSGDTERGSRGGAALQQPKYGAHGVWPTVLYTFVVMLLLWCLKMSYCILAGHLDGTPVSKHVVLWVLPPLILRLPFSPTRS